MVVAVQLYGRYAELLGADPLPVELTAGATVQTLAEVLEGLDPRLNGLSKYCRFAVDESYCNPGVVLSEGALVAVIPPVSGG